MINKITKKLKFIFPLMALAAGSCYGLGSALSTIIAGERYTVSQICFVQFAWGVLIFGAAFLLNRRHMKSIPSKNDILRFTAMGSLDALSTFFYYLAIRMMSVTAGVALQFSYVWIVVVIESIARKVLPKKITVISSILVVIGSVLGSGMADEIIAGELHMEPLGILAAAVCAVIYAFFIYLNGSLKTDANPVTISFFENIGGLIIVTVVMLVTGGFSGFDIIGLIPGGLVLSCLMCILPFALLAYAGPRLSGGMLAIMTSMELPVAVAAGVLLLHEETSVLIIFGIVLILLAIVAGQKDQK